MFFTNIMAFLQVALGPRLSLNMNVRTENSQDSREREDRAIDKVIKNIPTKKAWVSSCKRKLDYIFEKEMIQVLSNRELIRNCNSCLNTCATEMFLLSFFHHIKQMNATDKSHFQIKMMQLIQTNNRPILN